MKKTYFERRLVFVTIGILLLILLPNCSSKSEESINKDAYQKGQEQILDASIHLLNILDLSQKDEIMIAFESDERFNFHYIPLERVGLNLKSMNSDQRVAVHQLLQTALSSQGYLKIVGIMHLEDILAIVEGDEVDIDRDPELYYITFFGEPSKETPWGWRFEGHHISLNFTSTPNEFFASTPAFLGSNPGEVKSGPYTGLRVLAKEEDLGRALVSSFNDDQLKKAIILEEAPRDIVTRRDRQVMLEQRNGLPYSDMTNSQRFILMEIIDEYARNLRLDMANIHLERIYEAGVDSLYFGWAGGLEKGEPHYYRIHGPTVLFEYDNVQNNANHVHTVWRDLENDFGDDMLLRHYQTAHEIHGHSH